MTPVYYRRSSITGKGREVVTGYIAGDEHRAITETAGIDFHQFAFTTETVSAAGSAILLRAIEHAQWADEDDTMWGIAKKKMSHFMWANADAE